jgi:8-oxo-dGTP pyrophosphatase MutT (NUDIX family)
MNPERFKPSVTVAAVIAHPQLADHYLLIEEHTPEGLRLNNPAGHLEPGESPLEAVVREVLEETGCPFEAEAFLGVYLARFRRSLTGEDITYVRMAFSGRVGAAISGWVLDEGIVRTLWMSLAEIRAEAHRLRSPLVLQCIDDHHSGRRLPLQTVQVHESIYRPQLMQRDG